MNKFIFGFLALIAAASAYGPGPIYAPRPAVGPAVVYVPSGPAARGYGLAPAPGSIPAPRPVISAAPLLSPRPALSNIPIVAAPQNPSAAGAAASSAGVLRAGQYRIWAIPSYNIVSGAPPPRPLPGSPLIAPPSVPRSVAYQPIRVPVPAAGPIYAPAPAPIYAAPRPVY